MHLVTFQEILHFEVTPLVGKTFAPPGLVKSYGTFFLKFTIE